MSVMVTGGAGYIGSHAVQRLLREGQRVVAVDNLYRGHAEAIERLGDLARDEDQLTFAHADVGDRETITELLRGHQVEMVMHFSALAYVGESVDQPLLYYRNNAAAALSLIQACDEVGISRLVFSSTCATYGEPSEQYIPIPETCPQDPISPYGRSKLHVENFLFDYAESCRRAGGNKKPFGFAALRYFNVAGCDRSGLIGEDHEPETHLIPVILQTILGKRDSITIFGTDYPTPDGTCIRDYIHVEDLINAHIAAMNALQPGDMRTYNLGIGRGYSVREIIEAARRVTGREFQVKEGARRAGDPPQLFADPAKIQRELGWSASITDLDEIIASAWNWFRKHPDGYKSR